MRITRNIATLTDLLEFPFEATLPAAFIRNGGKYDQITYAEFRSMICQNVNELEDRDWKGKRIAVAGESGCGWAISFFTILCKGGTAVLLDNKADPASANGLLARAECIAIMADNAFLSKTELNKCIDKIEFSNNYGDLCADISYETDAEFHKCLPETPAVIAFTSGTTGDSKFVQLTHRNLTRDIISVVDYFENFIGPNKIVLPAVPFYHLFGLSCGMLIPLYYGMTIGYTNGLKYLNDTLSTMKPHLIVTVPVILENMIRKFQIPNADSLNKKELLVKRFLGGNIVIAPHIMHLITSSQLKIPFVAEIGIPVAEAIFTIHFNVIGRIHGPPTPAKPPCRRGRPVSISISSAENLLTTVKPDAPASLQNLATSTMFTASLVSFTKTGILTASQTILVTSAAASGEFPSS